MIMYIGLRLDFHYISDNFLDQEAKIGQYSIQRIFFRHRF